MSSVSFPVAVDVVLCSYLMRTRVIAHDVSCPQHHSLSFEFWVLRFIPLGRLSSNIPLYLSSYCYRLSFEQCVLYQFLSVMTLRPSTPVTIFPIYNSLYRYNLSYIKHYIVTMLIPPSNTSRCSPSTSTITAPHPRPPLLHAPPLQDPPHPAHLHLHDGRPTP